MQVSDDTSMLGMLRSINVFGAFWLDVPLRLQHIELLVIELNFWVIHDSQLLFNRRVFPVYFFQDCSFMLEFRLYLSGLWIKSVVVEPLVLELR